MKRSRMRRGKVSCPDIGFLASGRMGKAMHMNMNPHESVATLEGVIT